MANYEFLDEVTQELLTNLKPYMNSRKKIFAALAAFMQDEEKYYDRIKHLLTTNLWILDEAFICNRSPAVDIINAKDLVAFPSKDPVVLQYSLSLQNVSAVENARRVRRYSKGTIFSYAIGEIDENLASDLLFQDFKEVDDEHYYRYFANLNAHCHFISLTTLLTDATMRSMVFLEKKENSQQST